MPTDPTDERAAERRACARRLTEDRLTECDIVIGYDVTNHDAFVIKDVDGTTGRVSYAHALKRLALAKLRGEVMDEEMYEEGLDETPRRRGE